MPVKSTVDKQLPDPSDPLSKSVPLKAIELPNLKVLKVKDGASSSMPHQPQIVWYMWYP